MDSLESRCFEEPVHAVPVSCHNAFNAVDLTHLAIPAYQNVTFWKLAYKITYKRFVRDVDHSRRRNNLPPLGRFEMEAAFYQRLGEKYVEYDARLIEAGKSNEEKIELKKKVFTEALSKRRGTEIEQYWAEKVAKHPEIDIEIREEGTVADFILGYLREAAKLVKSGKDPWKEPLFASMTAEDLTFVKRRYETFANFLAEELEDIEPRFETKGIKDVEKGLADLRVEDMEVD